MMKMIQDPSVAAAILFVEITRDARARLRMREAIGVWAAKTMVL